MKQIVSMALPPMELPSVRPAQALNALLRVINPALKALKAWRWTIAGCLMAATAYGASLYDMANDSPGTTQKIQDALHVFGKELCQVTLV